MHRGVFCLILDFSTLSTTVEDRYLGAMSFMCIKLALSRELGNSHAAIKPETVAVSPRPLGEDG